MKNKQMLEEGKEALERTLLMMKYDMKKTLTENVEVINEQANEISAGDLEDIVDDAVDILDRDVETSDMQKLIDLMKTESLIILANILHSTFKIEIRQALGHTLRDRNTWLPIQILLSQRIIKSTSKNFTKARSFMNWFHRCIQFSSHN